MLKQLVDALKVTKMSVRALRMIRRAAQRGELEVK